jgi:hypothetical protein
LAQPKRLLVLTRHREGAPFRQRIEPYLAPLRDRGIAATVAELPKGLLARRREMLQAGRFDGVLLHRKTLTAWDHSALRDTERLIYDFDDAVMCQARDPSVPHGGRLRRFRRTIDEADTVIAGSPVLADHAREAGAEDVTVIPTGLDAGSYPRKQTYETSGPIRLVWIGSGSTLKQLESRRPILEALGQQIDGLVLRIIADAPFQVESLPVENRRWSPEVEARLLAESDVGLAPMPDTPYSRGKCGFKVLQYMAAGLPVVASPVGVNADYVKPGDNGFLPRAVDEWTDAVGKLAEDASLREQLGLAGRKRVAEEFDFSVLAPKFCDTIERALNEKRN